MKTEKKNRRTPRKRDRAINCIRNGAVTARRTSCFQARDVHGHGTTERAIGRETDRRVRYRRSTSTALRIDKTLGTLCVL